jgi:hypothetical protein
MNPTLESVVAQGLFVALALIALIWILGVQRIRTRRDRETPLATTVKGGL